MRAHGSAEMQSFWYSFQYRVGARTAYCYF